MGEGAGKKAAKASQQIRLAQVHELKALAVEEYEEYLKLVKNAEGQQQRLQLNWSKFHLFYEQSGCYYFKAKNNNDDSKRFVLHILKEIPLAVELYINIKIETINKIKNNILTYLDHFCKSRMKKIILLILLCEIKLNNLFVRQKDVSHAENKGDIHLIGNIIRLCHSVIEEVTRKLIPFFFSFNIFSPPDYFNYRFEHFHAIVEGIAPTG
ncbi:hypothetical protein PVBG_03540 [Plasmodium vivax Brazil I]|uniref:Uncharacterized protein n=1 Tax=Plasmodium vivax (strain Brazil I) TaxID=1033975 RepID=A0A0J9T1A1_PLAV1|nr:hypothetical protein PVBG_03540 [Plasmodium vivax Brazil I]